MPPTRTPERSAAPLRLARLGKVRPGVTLLTRYVFALLAQRCQVRQYQSRSRNHQLAFFGPGRLPRSRGLGGLAFENWRKVLVLLIKHLRRFSRRYSLLDRHQFFSPA